MDREFPNIYWRGDNIRKAVALDVTTENLVAVFNELKRIKDEAEKPSENSFT